MTSQHPDPTVFDLLVEERYLLDVLSSFFSGRPLPAVPDPFDDDLFASIAARQNAAHIAAFMALKYPGVFSSKLLSSVGGELANAISQEARQTAEFNALNQAFRRAGVAYMPLKGFLLRELYPEPYLRTMCDYDVLVREEDFKNARTVLEAQGFKYLKGDEHHDVFVKGSLVVEQHYKLFNASGAFGRGRSVSWKRLVHYEDTEYRFTNEDFYRFMLEHLLKHWISSQATLRDYLDAAFYLKRFGDSLDRKKLDADLDSDGTKEFVQTIERLVGVWFDGQPYDDVLREGTLYQFQRHPINSQTSKDGAVCCYASYLASSGAGGKKKRFARLRHLLTVFPQRVNYEVFHRLQDVPMWKKPFTGAALFIKFWFVRLTRKNFYRNLCAFMGAGGVQADRAAQFQRRMGLIPERFNAADWIEED